MRRGEIYYADLSPTVGSEINKRRPVLIVSNDANNRAASTVTVLPITSNTSRVYTVSPRLGNPTVSRLNQGSTLHQWHRLGLGR